MRKSVFFLLIVSLLGQACQTANKQTAQRETTQARSTPTGLPPYENPVLPGDYPDPSVAKIGQTYWATATSSEWAPLFPLMRSSDLINWEVTGFVFPDKMPDWAEANFWAPEISYDRGRVYIYYTAKKKGGSLCVGVASADSPAGPFRDHGPLVCQEAGSIDGFPIRDEQGNLYLIWKEDGNSRNLPTPIWGQRMNEERTALTGEKFELFRNDAPWEGNLVEGAALFRRGDYYYAFYAGNGCCGLSCTYGVGVARARKLTGPWEKHPRNPILTQNRNWKCPGHGTVLPTDSGKYYFLYHAYNVQSTVYAGRQGLLDEIEWKADGWPAFREHSPNEGEPAAPATPLVKAYDVTDNFNLNALSLSWQWPVSHRPLYRLESTGGGQLLLPGRPEKIGTVMGQRTKTAAYAATTSVLRNNAGANTWAGLAAVGDDDNALGISVGKDSIRVWQIKGGRTVASQSVAAPQAPAVQLRLQASEGHLFRFSWSTDGKQWNSLAQTLNGDYLPPWDRGVRVGLLAKGPAGSAAQFDWFRLSHKNL